MKRSIAFALALSGALATTSLAKPAISVTESDDTITIACGDRPFLTYQKAVVPPPEGQNPLYARSGFIHPVHSPAGAVLTGIHPADHYHHIGLWHPWVKTKFRGHDVDFWNLAKGQGTVRYAKTVEITDDGFTVEQEHVDLTPEAGPEVVLRDRFSVSVSKHGDAYLIDYTTRQTNVTDAVLELPQNRYGGGIAYRAPHHWDNSNSDYLSSEGKTRVDGHTTRSRWIAMGGATDAGKSTLTILNHPSNHDHPQRMRVWPPSSHNGAIFFNYCPVQETGWAIQPGTTATLRYRIATFDSPPVPAKLDALWQDYAEKSAQD